jgi:hypothetical protein
MANNTFVKIATVTVGSGGASSIAFSSIPSTYTDLCLKISARNTDPAAGSPAMYIGFNSSTSSFSNRYLYGNGASATSGTGTTGASIIDGGSNTTSTFASTEIYIPNYTSSNYKSYSIDNVQENNATTAYAVLYAGLWSNTAAITSIQLTGDANFAQYSTATLYGIKNS